MNRALWAAAAFLVVGAVVALRPAPTPPNVLVIVWDTVRADRMSLYGHERPTTPRIAAWAEGARVYDAAISPAMWTVPSHASLFTGTHVSTHGAHVTYKWLDAHHVTMAEWFGSHGYDTFAFSANPNLSTEHYNLMQGFDVVLNPWAGRWRKPSLDNTRRKLIERDRSSEISPAWPGKKMEGKQAYAYNAGPVAHDALMAWLGQREDDARPWLAFVNMMEAHKPRVPSKKARRQVVGDDRELYELGLETDISHHAQMSYMVGRKAFSNAELEAIRAVYDASLVDLDDATADLLDDLEQRGLLDDTLVVLTSDHGEALGEHQLFAHRAGLYQDVVGVPLVIGGPGVAPGRVQAPVSPVHLFSTLARAAGIELPPTALDADLLAPGAGGEAYTEIASASEARFGSVLEAWPDADLSPFLRTVDAVVDGDRKLIRYCDGQVELFDLGGDPAEDHDLSVADPASAAALGDRLDAWRSGVAPYDPALRTADDTPEDVSEEARGMLEVLGYIETEGVGRTADPCATRVP